MEKIEKTVEVWVSRDGREFTSEFLCEQHERVLDEEKVHTLTQRMGEATMKWIADNEYKFNAMERVILGIDEFGRTPDQVMIDETLDWEPLDPNSPDIKRARHARFAEFAIRMGWWFDATPNHDPIPFPTIQDIADLEAHEKTMAHVLARHGVFKSVSDAKKNGWDKEITLGDHWFKKKTLCIRIVST